MYEYHYGIVGLWSSYSTRDFSTFGTFQGMLMIAALSSPASGEPQGKLCSGDDAPNMVTTAVLQ